MEPEVIYWALAGIAALITAVAGLSIGMWKWDARRIRADAEADIRRAEERAVERQHELELARLAVQKDAHEREVDLLGRLERQKAEIADIRRTIEERLFVALDDARQAKVDLRDVIDRHIKAVDQANHAELAAIEALRGDVGGLRDRLTGEYKAILTQMGAVIEQSSTVNRMMTDLVGCVAAYHERVESAIQRQEKTQGGADGEDRQAQKEQESKGHERGTGS